MKKTLLFVSSAVLAVTAANASAAATSGIFVGGNLGYASVSTPDAKPAGFSQSDNNFAWGLNLGGNYAINPNVMIGIQGGYTSFGNTKYSFNGVNIFTLSTSSWDLLATGTYVFNSGFNIFGKAGMAYEIENNDFVGTSNNTAVRPQVGAGVGYMWNNMNFSLEYRHIFADSQDVNTNLNGANSVPSVNAVMFGISYQFPL